MNYLGRLGLQVQWNGKPAYSGPALTLFEDLHQLRVQGLGLTAQLRRLFPSRCRCTPCGGKIRLRPALDRYDPRTIFDVCCSEVTSENGLQSTLRGVHALKTNGLARLHHGDNPDLPFGFKLLILFARNFHSVLYCPFPEAPPRCLSKKAAISPNASLVSGKRSSREY
jgi:hypothetical protein